MYYYNNGGKLQTSAIPLKGKTPVQMTAEQVEICTGFDVNGIPIFDQSIIDRKNERIKEKQINDIKNSFEIGASDIGVEFNGVFYTIEDGTAVFNPKFQYDFLSIQKLESVVSDARVSYWRTVDNKNLSMTLQNKMDLLELLKVTYFLKFKESRDAIDAL